MNEKMEQLNRALQEYHDIAKALKQAQYDSMNQTNLLGIDGSLDDLYNRLNAKFKNLKEVYESIDIQGIRQAAVYYSRAMQLNDILNMERQGKEEYIPGTRVRKPRDRQAGETDEEYIAFLNTYYSTIFRNLESSQDENSMVVSPEPSLEPIEPEIIDLPAIAPTKAPIINNPDIMAGPVFTPNNSGQVDDIIDLTNEPQEVIMPENHPVTRMDPPVDDIEEAVIVEPEQLDTPVQTPQVEQTNEKASGKLKWLAGAAGFGLGATVALTAVGGPVVAAAFTAVAAINFTAKATNFVNKIITHYNEQKGNFQKDENGNVIVDQNGRPQTKPTFIDKIKEKIPEPIKKGVAVVTGNTKNQTWNWFVNGVSLGYATGNVVKNFIPKPETANVNANTPQNPNPNPNPNPQPTPPDNTIKIGDSVDMSAPKTVAKDIYGQQYDSIQEAFKNVRLAEQQINPNTGEVMDLFVDQNGVPLGRFADSVVQSAGKKL